MEFFTYLKVNNIDYSEEDGTIVVHGGLYLEGSQITIQPNKLSVDENLSLVDAPITKLPENLSVGGYFDLSQSNITELPKNLSVGDWLNLSNTKITELPENFSVREYLLLDVEKITNISYCKYCSMGESPIFAAYVNEAIQICAGPFLGTLETFEVWVDELFANHAETEKYKQSARECLKELEEMRNR